MTTSPLDRFRSILLAVPALAVCASAQQGAELPAFDPPHHVNVPWRGAEPDNRIVEEPAPEVTSRSTDARTEKALGDWQDMLLRKFDEFTQPVEGQSNPREAKYTLLNAFVGASLMGAAGTTLAGGGAGALVGGIITSESGGWGAVPGLAIGGGAGITVGAVGIGGTVIAAMLMADEIERRYPYDAADVTTRGLEPEHDDSSTEFAEVWPDPTAWIVADAVAADPDLAAASTTDGDVTTRDLGDPPAARRIASNAGTTAVRPTARVAAANRKSNVAPRYAGPQESLFIHVIAELVAPKANELARHWDNMPGLTTHQRTQLRSMERPLRGWIQRLDYVRANHRLSSRSPVAVPLSAWQQSVVRSLTGGAGAQAWLDALAIGSTRLAIDGKRVTWSTPRALRDFGAPASFAANIGSLYARVMGFGGSLSAKIEPGDFAIELGSVRADGDKLRVEFRVQNGTRIAAVEVKGKLGNVEQSLVDFRPKLTSNLRGDLYFTVGASGVRFHSVDLGGLQLSLGIPKIQSPLLAPLDGLRQNLEAAVRTELGKLFGNHLGWADVFRELDRFAPQSLLACLQRDVADLGLVEIARLTGMRVRNGQLELQVEGSAWQGAPRSVRPQYEQQIRALFP